ncbi:hypothetical protein, partial [Neisseria meningitidis]|uniref:hypothetical protein n=1 Tax=Neisseria meningitidis TaxID=487 RepID=UPI00198191FC
GENSRKPVFGFRLSGGKGILQRSHFVHFVFSFGLFEWLNRGLGADGAASARFLGVGGFLINSPNLKSRHSREGGNLGRGI